MAAAAAAFIRSVELVVLGAITALPRSRHRALTGAATAGRLPGRRVTGGHREDSRRSAFACLGTEARACYHLAGEEEVPASCWCCFAFTTFIKVVKMKCFYFQENEELN